MMKELKPAGGSCGNAKRAAHGGKIHGLGSAVAPLIAMDIVGFGLRSPGPDKKNRMGHKSIIDVLNDIIVE